jgi:hypothetical protein
MKSAVPAEETTALQWMNSFAAQRTKYLRFSQVQIYRAPRIGVETPAA